MLLLSGRARAFLPSARARASSNRALDARDLFAVLETIAGREDGHVMTRNREKRHNVSLKNMSPRRAARRLVTETFDPE